MSKMFMVRSGEGNYLFSYNKENKIIAIGWNKLGDLSNVHSFEAIKKMMIEYYAEDKLQTQAMNAGQVNRFVNLISEDDFIITYCSELRIYLVGKAGKYQYNDQLTDYFHSRKVEWLGEVKRDALSVKTKNSLGSIATVFEVSEFAKEEVLAVLEKKPVDESFKSTESSDAEDTLSAIKDDYIARSHEFIKDKVSALSWEDMQELVAAILRAMGFKTTVSKKGGDRGKDVIASPDGLCLEEPRIFVEVKHREKSMMGAPEIRSFIGGLRQGSKGIFVSTGGFTKEARYEAERSVIPLTLIDIDDLVNLIIDNYDNFDVEGRTLIPLKKIYWPLEG